MQNYHRRSNSSQPKSAKKLKSKQILSRLSLRFELLFVCGRPIIAGNLHSDTKGRSLSAWLDLRQLYIQGHTSFLHHLLEETGGV